MFWFRWYKTWRNTLISVCLWTYFIKAKIHRCDFWSLKIIEEQVSWHVAPSNDTLTADQWWAAMTVSAATTFQLSGGSVTNQRKQTTGVSELIYLRIMKMINTGLVVWRYFMLFYFFGYFTLCSNNLSLKHFVWSCLISILPVQPQIISF